MVQSRIKKNKPSSNSTVMDYYDFQIPQLWFHHSTN